MDKNKNKLMHNIPWSVLIPEQLKKAEVQDPKMLLFSSYTLATRTKTTKINVLTIHVLSK